MKPIKLHHQVKGEGEPLVLIAGFSADHMAWLPLVDSLSRHFQVVTFDNRGAGQSPTPDEPSTIDNFVHDTLGLMDDLGIEKAHILGQSMGTIIGQYIAAGHPERVNKLILSNSFTKSDKTSHYAFRLIGHLMEDQAPRERYMEAMLPWCFSNEFLSHQANVDLIIDLYKSNPYPQSVQGFWSQFNAALEADTSPIMHKIKAKTLIIACDEDLLTNLNDAREVHAGIEGSELVIIKGMAHVPHVERPAEFIEIVLNFLKG